MFLFFLFERIQLNYGEYNQYIQIKRIELIKVNKELQFGNRTFVHVWNNGNLLNTNHIIHCKIKLLTWFKYKKKMNDQIN